MNYFWAVVNREIRRIFSQKSYLFLVVVWPVAYGLFLGAVYSQRVVTEMPIAVADHDHSSLSRTVVRYLGASRSLKVAYFVQTKEEIEDLIAQEKIAAGVYIPSGLQREIKRGGSEVVTGFVSGVNLLMANTAIAELKTVLGTVSAGVKIKYLRKTGNSSEKAMTLQSPVQVDLLRLYNPGFNYQNYLAPGLWATAIQQILLLVGSLLIVREFEKRSFADLWATGGKQLWVVIAGKILPYYIGALVLFEIYFRIFFPAFDVDVHGNISAMVVYSAAFVFSCLSLGFMLSTIFGSSVNALKGVLLIAAPAFLVSGYTWPLFQMPAYVRAIAQCIPLTSYLQGFRKLYQQGAGMSSVTGELVVLFGMGFLGLIVGAAMLQRKVRKDEILT